MGKHRNFQIGGCWSAPHEFELNIGKWSWKATQENALPNEEQTQTEKVERSETSKHLYDCFTAEISDTRTIEKEPENSTAPVAEDKESKEEVLKQVQKNHLKWKLQTKLMFMQLQFSMDHPHAIRSRFFGVKSFWTEPLKWEHQ